MRFLPFRGSRCHISQLRVKKREKNNPTHHSPPAWHRIERVPICRMFDFFFFFLVLYEPGGRFGGEINVSVCISSPEDTGITCFGNEQLRPIQVNDEAHCDTHTPFCFYANASSDMHACVCLLPEWERSLSRRCD